MSTLAGTGNAYVAEIGDGHAAFQVMFMLAGDYKPTQQAQLFRKMTVAFDAAYRALPPNAREALFRLITNSESVNEHTFLTVCFGYGEQWIDFEWEFHTKTLKTLEHEYGLNENPDAEAVFKHMAFKAYAEILLSDIRVQLETCWLVNSWENPADKKASDLTGLFNNITTEVKSYLPPPPKPATAA